MHRDGNEVARLGPGDYFGERGLLDNAPRNASVTTAEPSTVLRLEGNVLLDVLSSAPTLRTAIDRSREEDGPRRRCYVEAVMSMEGKTLAIVGAGYWGKRRSYARLADLGARLVVIDEQGHWSSSLVDDGIAVAWLPVAVTGDADADSAAIVAALSAAGIRPDGVMTIWEPFTAVTQRVAFLLGLPGNPPDAVDAARSKVRTRELSTALGLPTPKARRVASLDELFAASSYVGFPAVVKPEFGLNALGCVRVDDVESLPKVYSMVRDVITADKQLTFRAGNDLLVEQYLDGVEFDVDLIMHHGECVFSSVSQNWPTVEPSFQETGLHCPPDHNHRQVDRLVDLTIETAKRFGLHQGVLHIEGKCTSQGPRVIEVNARMGGGRVAEIVREVWGVDLVEAAARGAGDRAERETEP